MIDYSEFAHTDVARKGISDEVKKLMEEGVSESDAVRMAASTLDGAGDNPEGTVESVQTCLDIEGRSVVGLTGDDVPIGRKDEYGKNEEQRHAAAESGVDEAEAWLRKNDPEYRNRRK